jgi:hypothetical protein
MQRSRLRSRYVAYLISLECLLTHLPDLICLVNTLGHSRGPLRGVDTTLLYRGLPYLETIRPSPYGRDLLLYV